MSFVLGGLSTTQHYPVVLGREKGEREEGGQEGGRRGEGECPSWSAEGSLHLIGQ